MPLGKFPLSRAPFGVREMDLLSLGHLIAATRDTYTYIFISPRCRSWSKCVSLPVSAPCVLLLHRIDACARWSVYSERERRRSRGPRPTHYYSPAVWGVAGCCVFAPERELHAAETLETEARDDEQTMCN
jgi:hypothetical protein